MVLQKFLKFLAGLLVLVAVLGILVAVGGYFAVRGLNPNIFRSELEQYLIRQTGFRTELGEMRFKWGPQLELQVDSLKIYHPKSLEKLLQSDNVRIYADLASLWRKRFWMPQILILNPEISLKRTADGSWNWQVPKNGAGSGNPVIPAMAAVALVAHGDSAAIQNASTVTAVRNLPGGAGGWEFGLGKLEIRHGTLQFIDETIQPVFRLKIEQAEVLISQKTGDAAFHYRATAMITDLAQKNIGVEGDADLISQSLDFSLRYEQDKVLFKGTLKVVNTVPRFDGSLDVTNLKIETVTPDVYKRGDYVAGLLNAKMQLSFEGANPESMKRTLRGQGKVSIRDGALKNRNMVKEIFDRLSPVVAVTSALGGQLPPEVSAMLQDRDTPFQSMALSCTAVSGVVRAEELSLLHPNYQLTGSVTYNIMDQNLDSMMQVTLSQVISAYLVQKVRELQYVSDRNGLVTIPFRYGGKLPDATVQPDLSFIGSKLLQDGTDQLLNRGIEQLSKYLERKKKK